jgi:menaquinol-cytochrome c reductase iron-sulfur subunit
MSEDLNHSEKSTTSTLSPEAKAAAHSRRSFLFKLSVLLNAAVGTVLAVPIMGYLLAPAMRKDSAVDAWVSLGAVEGFPIGETRLVDFESPVSRLGDGQTAKVACWVRRISAQQFQVFAINCAHLGCPVRWFAQSKLFMCPCHGGAYYEDGSRASGPPERGLFEYQYKIAGSSLTIHAGDMPTLATQASCSGTERSTGQEVSEDKQLVQIETASAESRSKSWPA